MILRPRDTLLFIGDSITHAHRRAYEHHDCYNLGCGYVNHLAAALNTDHPDLALTFINAGECGDTVNHLADRWEPDCLRKSPTLISILVGINDANPGNRQPPDQFLKTYRSLLHQTRQRLPNTRIILVEPFFLAIPDLSREHIENCKTRQPMVAHLASEIGATFVPLQQTFNAVSEKTPPSHWALDGVHPSAAGHQLIARAWLKAVGA